MASALTRLRKARQDSETGLASPTITSGTGGSALARLRAARKNAEQTSITTPAASNTSTTGTSALARLRAARKTKLTPEAQIYASDEEKMRNSQTSEEKDVGGLLGGIGYTLEKVGLGFLQGVEGVVDYAVGGLAELFGADDYSEDVIANDWLDYNHADSWYKPSEGWKFVGDVGGGIGTSLPGLLAGVAVTAATGGTGIGAGVGLALSGLSAAGTSTKEAYLESGELTGKQYGYGAVMGGIEAATEKLTGMLGTGLTKAVSSVSSALGKAASKTAASLTAKGVAKQLGKEFISEAFEEGAAEILSPVVKRLTYDKNAEFASADEIAYAALVGGLSGVVMGGAGMGTRSVRHIASGKKISDSGKIKQTLELGQMYADIEADEATGSASIKAISEIMPKLAGVKDGDKLTAGQRRMLGELAEYTTVAPLENVMRKSAITAVNGAEAIAQKLASDGNVKLVDGKLAAVTAETVESLTREGKEVRDITAEDITKGYDSAKPETILKALQDNEVLRYVAASDASSRLILTANQLENAALSGSTIRNQVDLNRFIEETNRSPERRAALGRELGISDNEWDTLQLGRFNEAIRAYRESGKADAYKRKAATVEKAKAIPETEAKKKIPSTITLGDGKIQRYTSGRVDIAVSRNGSSFIVYDYNSGDTSRSLTRVETNTVLAEMKAAGEVNIPTESAAPTTSAETAKEAISPNARRAIEISENNTPFVVVEEDILDGVDEKDWIKTVKSNLSSKFPDGVTLGNNVVDIDRQSRKEMTFSKYMQWLRTNNPQAFSDKLRATNNADEILVATQGWVSEGLDHPRKDNITDFARGTVLLSIGGNDYSASVVVGTHKNGKMMLYDIIDLAPTKITKKETSEAIPENSSRRAERKTTPISKTSIPNSSEKVNTSEQKTSEKSTKEKIAEVRERLDAKKIDEYLTENVKDYSDLGEANRSMIRKIVREGRAHGLDDADVLSYARVAARSGLNIEFDASMKDGEAGYFDPDKNRIVVNPKTTKKQELILIHELDHAIRAYIGNDGKIHYLTYKDAEKKLSEETSKRIREEYADQDVDVSREELFADEASAYYAEAILGGKGFLDILLGNEPTLQQKILSFFTGAAQTYSNDANLSKAARAHYGQFKKMFADFAERNKGRNAETAVDNGKLTVESGKSVRQSKNVEAKLAEFDESELSNRTFSYKELTAKGDIEGYVIDKSVQVPLNSDGSINGKQIVADVRKKCQSTNTNSSSVKHFVPALDIGRNVEITSGGITHGFFASTKKNKKPSPRDLLNAKVSIEIPRILKNSVEVNRSIRPGNPEVPFSRVMMGTVGIDNGTGVIEYYAIRSVVEERINLDPILLESKIVGKLYAVNAKKIDSPNPKVAKNSVARGYGDVYTYNIAQFLQDVKGVFDDTFSVDVYNHLGVTRANNDFSNNLRFSKDIEATLADDRDKVTISKGQAQKQKANYNSDRVYSKKDVETALDGIEGFGNLPEDVRDEIFRDVWIGLNSYYDKSKRQTFIKTMEYKVPYMLMTNAFTEENLIKSKELRKEKWRAKKKLEGEALAKRLSEIDHEIEALQGTTDHLFDTYDQERIDEIKQEIVDKLNKLLDGGKPSLRAKMESEFNESDAGKWKAKYYEALDTNKIINNILYQAGKMRELHLGTFLNATDYNNQIFEDTFVALRSITYRGDISEAKVREAMQKLSEWYKPDNPVLKEIPDSPGSGYYSDYIALQINELATGKGKLSMRELEMLDNVLRHATRIVENFNRVWKNGKWVNALDTAKDFVKVAHTTTRLRSSADMRKLSRMFDSLKNSYLTAFGDPMTVFRYMDGYQDGFFSWAGEELRAGAFRHGVDVMEMKTEYDKFLEKDHKGYLKNASKETVEYGGAQMSKLQYISLYMTMQRAQAQRGLAFNGISFIDVNGRRVEVDGFISRMEAKLGAELGITKDPDGTWQVSDEQMNKAANTEIDNMKKKLSAEDVEFIGIIESTLNGKCKELKTARDMERLGYSNTISGYYYPIVRAMIAKTIDSRGMWGELDRASNISANKNTVRGAAGALWIESVDTVFNRHIDAVARYAELSPAIDAINKIFNLDVSGNKNKPKSVRSETFNTWQINKLLGGTPSDAQKHNGEAYLKDLLADLQGIGKDRGVGAKLVESIRGGFAISSLAANPKVLLTQLSSLFASTNMLPYKSLAFGMWLGFKHGAGDDLDKYCPIAKLRNYDVSAAKAQGVLDNVRGVGETLMKGVSFMDRGVVRMLWGACQAEIESTKKLKIGTEENMTEAGKLLERVLQETQQGSVATEKSAAMRSTSWLARSITMFTSDAMKGAGRFIDSHGRVASLNARIKMAEESGDKKQAEALRVELEKAKEEARKSFGALLTTALYMTLISRAFSWLYAKDDEEERPALAFIADVFGGMIGGLPGFSDVYDFATNGYEISDSVYDSLNDVLTAVRSIFTTAIKWNEGEATGADFTGSAINVVQTVCTSAGIPFRNVRNTLMGLSRRFLPNAAYRLEMLTESKNYERDFEEAIDAGDEDKAYMILEMLLSERLTREGELASFANSVYLAEAYRMDKAGYNIKPRTIGDSVMIGDEEVDMTPEEQAALRARYSEAVGDIETLIGSAGYASLTDEQKSKAVRFVYDSYYDVGIYELYGYERNMKRRIFSKAIPADKLALAYAATSGIESDYTDDGAVSGSRRKKVIAAINRLPLTTAEKLLIIAYKGYSFKDGDVRGISAERAKKLLISYLLKLNITKDDKAELAEACGFKVKNGRISLK